MKKTATLLALTVLAASFASNATAQNRPTQKRAVQQAQPQVNQQGQQRTYVNPGYQQPTPKLGFNGQMIYGYGMKVVSVNWGSAAQRAGLESGDVILKINGRQIRSQWDYDQALQNSANFNYGRVNMKVRNVRYDWGHQVPMFAYVNTVLDGFQGGPVGPVGPRQQQGPVAPRSQQQVKPAVAFNNR